MPDDVINAEEISLFTTHSPIKIDTDRTRTYTPFGETTVQATAPVYHVGCACGWVDAQTKSSLTYDEGDPRDHHSASGSTPEWIERDVRNIWLTKHVGELGEIMVPSSYGDIIPTEVVEDPDAVVRVDHAGFHFYSDKEKPDPNNPLIFAGDNIPREHMLSFTIGLYDLTTKYYDLRNGNTVDDLRKFLGDDYTYGKWKCLVREAAGKPYETSGSWPLTSNMNANFVPRY